MVRELTFSKAEAVHVEQLVALVNSAYRGDVSRQGWTTEADLLDGRRTDPTAILEVLADADSMILLCMGGSELYGSVHIEKNGDDVQIGMLAVSPPLQGQGIGKRLLHEAERLALHTWKVRRFVMSVIPSRLELMAFYERRGYRRTAIEKPFPKNPELWTPKVDDLCLELLEKWL